MVTQRFKIELCRPVGACVVGTSAFVGFHPTLIYVAPLGLAIDNKNGSTRISLPLINKYIQI